LAVESQSLIDAFKRQSNVDFDIEAAFKRWETQAGYPVLTAYYDIDVNIFVVTQQKYHSDSATDSSNWFIPINLATAFDPNFEDTTFTHYFDGSSLQFEDDSYSNWVDGEYQWFLFNKQAIGYYRVNYEITNWNALIEVLNSDNYEVIHSLNRAQLVDDVIAFAADGRLDNSLLFSLLNYLSRETSFTPFATAERFFDDLYSVFGHQNVAINVSFYS